MKKLVTLILLAGLCALSGCASTNQNNAGAFLSKIATMDVTAADISQSTNTPLYSHAESISGLHHDANHFQIENLKATFAIPLWGVTWNFSASSIQGATPQSLAQVAKAAIAAKTP